MAALVITDKQFTNTKMCKFEVLGRCKKGQECPFAHTSKELNPLPDLHRTKLCKSFMLTGICADANCGYAHAKDELRSTGTFYKTKLCRFMKAGHCVLGKKCNFAHCDFDLRSVEDAIEEDPMLHESIMPPPSLGQWKNPSADNQYSDTDLNALTDAWDLMLSQRGETLDSVKDQALDLRGPLTQAWASTFRHDEPAYIRWPSALHISAFGMEKLGTPKVDYMNRQVSNDSTLTPSQGDSPSTSESGCSSGMSSNHKSSGQSNSRRASKEYKKSNSMFATISTQMEYTGQEAAMRSFYNEGGWDVSPSPLAILGSMWTPYTATSM